LDFDWGEMMEEYVKMRDGGGVRSPCSSLTLSPYATKKKKKEKRLTGLSFELFTLKTLSVLQF